MTLKDAAGLVGVAIILAAYAAATWGRMHPKGLASLALNFVGASLILFTLVTQSFNLSAALIEAAWALISLVGLVRIALRHGRPL
jgi:hypothetical protein